MPGNAGQFKKKRGATPSRSLNAIVWFNPSPVSMEAAARENVEAAEVYAPKPYGKPPFFMSNMTHMIMIYNIFILCYHPTVGTRARTLLWKVELGVRELFTAPHGRIDFGSSQASARGASGACVCRLRGERSPPLPGRQVGFDAEKSPNVTFHIP